MEAPKIAEESAGAAVGFSLVCCTDGLVPKQSVNVWVRSPCQCSSNRLFSMREAGPDEL